MADRKQEILDAALAVADEKGLDAVSMRAVAQRVGLTPMALYPHVGDKTALLDAMVGQLLAELEVPDPAAPWPARLDALAQAARGLAKRHPTAIGLLFSRPGVTPEAVLVIDAVYQALLDAGVPDAEVPRLERMFSTLVFGYGMSEAGGRFGAGTVNPRGRRGRLPSGTLPAHERLAAWLDAPANWDAEFTTDLADLRALIELIASRNDDIASQSDDIASRRDDIASRSDDSER